MVRDFLHNSQEITRVFDNDLKEDFDAYVLVCHAYLANFKRRWTRTKEEMPEVYMSFQRFMHHARDIQTRFGNTRRINNVLAEAKRIYCSSNIVSGMLSSSSPRIDQLPCVYNKELHFDGVAAQYGLEFYITQQLGKQQIDVREHDLLGYALFDYRFGKTRRDVVNPTIVNCLLNLGADPNHRPEGRNGPSLWGEFVNLVCTTAGFKEDPDGAVFVVMGDLIAHGAGLGYMTQQRENQGDETVKEDLQYLYPEEYQILVARAPTQLANIRTSRRRWARRRSTRPTRRQRHHGAKDKLYIP
ncbi:hypothetical protein PG994_013908 [Apiospora phragmitis]|uniref:Uncharacterized protein n=1 Tax=Apiospora phragmitis TaxID=2905665 RepID=A0ABR1T2T6_9PEZI